jgi:hypothetical protein
MFVSVEGGVGIGLKPEIVRVLNRSGGVLNAGQVAAFDLSQSDADVSNNNEGDANGVWSNVIAPAGAGAGAFCLILDDIADNAMGLAITEGIAQALMIAASGSIAPGDGLVPDASGNLDLIWADGEIGRAIALTAHATPTSAVLGWVLFMGGGPGVGTGISGANIPQSGSGDTVP